MRMRFVVHFLTVNCVSKGKKACTSRAATKSSTAFAHTEWPFVFICVACAFTLSFPRCFAPFANFISKMLDDFVFSSLSHVRKAQTKTEKWIEKKTSKLLSKEQSQHRINVVQTDTSEKENASDIVTSSSKCRFVLRLICFFFLASSLLLPSVFTSH